MRVDVVERELSYVDRTTASEDVQLRISLVEKFWHSETKPRR